MVPRNLPNMYTDYDQFLERIKTNTDHDLLEFRYTGESDPETFKRYGSNFNIDTATYQQVSKHLLEVYINPLMEVTGYRFPIRDYHKGGRKSQKISFMLICSQDKAQQRKSRSSEHRVIPNKLKVEDCKSKLTMTYSLQEGTVTLFYNHKAHRPYMWRKNKGDSQQDPHLSEQRYFEDSTFAEQLQQLQQRSTIDLQRQYEQQQLNQREPAPLHQGVVPQAQPQPNYSQRGQIFPPANNQFQRYPQFYQSPQPHYQSSLVVPSKQHSDPESSHSPIPDLLGSNVSGTYTDEEQRTYDAAAQIIAVAQQQQQYHQQNVESQRSDPLENADNSTQKAIDEGNIDKELISLNAE